jgi:polysaccharide export outer membrane protein
MVSSDGTINVPFAGQIAVSGLSTQQVDKEIEERLKNKANHPQVIVRLTHNNSEHVTVVGEVNSSVRMPLTSLGEKLLDALAAAGGVKQPIGKIMIQLTRGAHVFALPLETIILDPDQNIALRAGDVITALYQPLSFTVLGATGKNDEVDYEAKGISLAQALARSGGLIDARADAKGVFIFRFESVGALGWPSKPITAPDGKVPVIYWVNLKDPASFFIAQTFPVRNKDLIYVSNAPAAELQKFLNIVGSITSPILNLGSNATNLAR